MSIAKRIVITLAIALVSLVVVGGAGILGLKNTNDNVAYVLDNTMPSMDALHSVSDHFYDARTLVLRHIMEIDTAAQTRLEAALKEDYRQLDATLDTFGKLRVADAKDRQLLEADKQAIAAYKKVVQAILQQSQGGMAEDARQLAAGDGQRKAQQVLTAIGEHIRYNQSLAAQQKSNAASTYRDGLVVSLLVMAGAVLVTLLFGWRLFRIIAAGLGNIRDTVNTVSQHLDFTKRAAVGSQDEVGDTIEAFNRLLERMQANLKTLQAGASQVADNAGQMATTAQQLSQTAGDQSEASANVAATVQQMTVSINHVADRAGEALALAQSSGELAREGSSTIAQTIADIRDISSTVSNVAVTIKNLEAQGAEIGSVVAVIKEVAEQTNLLALNAAIEAARVGEQGRGFAVVADEVRKLAERTASSTREIARTIDAMHQHSQQATQQMASAVELVSSSVSRADLADNAIQAIGQAADNTRVMVGDIADAIREQSAASTNIAVQVERIVAMTEAASAASSQTAAGAGALDDLASRQMGVLRQYVL